LSFREACPCEVEYPPTAGQEAEIHPKRYPYYPIPYPLFPIPCSIFDIPPIILSAAKNLIPQIENRKYTGHCEHREAMRGNLKIIN